tara:strand:+ start:497 stop:751 length:255 start_codon:yes stop_codon:yes gene_type:complete
MPGNYKGNGLWANRLVSGMRDEYGPPVKTDSVTPSGDYMTSLLSRADGACLLWEVVWFALWHMKKNPELSVEEAFELGYCEWLK